MPPAGAACNESRVFLRSFVITLKSCFYVLTVMLFLPTAQRQAFAQTAPGTNADANNPSGAPDPMKEDSIWQVNPITGALSVKIPFTTTPQGGRGPKIPFALLYNSSATVTLQPVGEFNSSGYLGEFNASTGTTTAEFLWAPGNVTATPAIAPVGPWTTSGPFNSTNQAFIPSYTPTYSNGVMGPTQQGCSISGPFLYTDENGATHDLDVSYMNGYAGAQSSANCSEAYSEEATIGTTVDGSSIQGAVPGIASIGNSTEKILALYPDGMQYLGGSTLEDTNGNISTLAQDSTGRTPFSTTIPIGLPGVIPAATYSVTTSGTTGNPEKYSVVVSAVPIGGYTMTHPSGSAEFSQLQTPSDLPVTSYAQQVTPGVKVNVVTEVSLPDGNAYTFTYDPTYGTISKIAFPTGGYVRFVYGIRSNIGGYSSYRYISGVVVTDVYLSSGNGIENHWNYNLPAFVYGSTQLTSTVTAPDGSYTEYTGNGTPGGPIQNGSAATSWREVQHVTYSASGAILESVSSSYSTTGFAVGFSPVSGGTAYLVYPSRPQQIATTLYNASGGTQRQEQFLYDMYDNVIEHDESDFYGCSGSPCSAPTNPPLGWLRRTFTTYNYQKSSAWVTAHIVNKPSQVLVTDGNGVPASLVVYGYDEVLVTGAGSTINHDGTNYGVNSALPRGNLTSENHCVMAGISAVTPTTAQAACTQWLKTTHTYDATGQVLSSTDPNKYTTSFSYADSYAGSTQSGTNSYLTKVSHFNGMSDTYSFDYYTGELASHTDWNNQLTSYVYADSLNRPTAILPPIGSTTINYNGDALPLKFTTTVATGTAAGPLVSTTIYDGLGRVSEKQVVASGAETDKVDTTYDALGRVFSVSNPYAGSQATGFTTYLYDSLGRKLFECQPGIITVGASNCGTSNAAKQLVYSNNTTDSYDEVGVHHQQVSDGIGRLLKVFELGIAANPLNYETDYGYDALGNLKRVDQWGGPEGNAGDRVRTFTYDMESRLLCASNPENSSNPCPTSASATLPSGVTSYSYDGDGNVSLKTDARGRSTTYGFSNMNWLTSKTYNDGTSNVAYGYNGLTPSGSPTGMNFNGIGQNGRLSSATSGASASSSYAYDVMGRLTAETSSTPALTSTTYQTYDQAGRLQLTTYPDGRLLNRTLDGAGRTGLITNQFNASSSLQTYFSESGGYDPAGHLNSGTFGNVTLYTAGYDNRERVQNLAYGPLTAPIWSKQYAWTANSNLQSQTDLITGIQRQFGYDNLNRITSAQDIYSNLAVASVSNDETTSTSTSGSGAAETPGATGALPIWTNSDDSNLLEDLGAAGTNWVLTNSAVALNQGPAPDGSATAVTVTATGTSSYLAGAVASPASYSLESMTASVWLRSVNGNQSVNLDITDDFPGGWGVPAATQVQLTPVWQQFQVTGQGADSLTGLSFYVGQANGQSTFQPFQMWNPMLEDAGQLGTSVTNFLPFSERFSTSTWNNTGTTMVKDDTGSAPDGTNTAATLVAQSSDAFMLGNVQNPAPYSGSSITGSVWLRSTGGPQTLYFGLADWSSGGLGLQGSIITLSNVWQRYQTTIQTQSTLTALQLQIGGANTFNTGQTVQAWGAQIELASSAGPYVGTAGIPVTQATTLTNLLPYSQQINGASWNVVAGSVKVSSDTAPDGSDTAGTLIGASWGPNNEYPAYVVDNVPNPALYDGQTVTASVYMRSPTGTPMTENIYIDQVLTGGSITSFYQTITLNSKWQRFSVTETLQNGLTGLYFQVGNSFSEQSEEIWGAQLELNSHAGPYVATSAMPIVTASEPTNILPNSQATTGPNWSITNGNLTSTTTTAPDGSNTGATFINSATADGFVDAFVPNPSLYDGETVTTSVYLRSSASSGSETVNMYLIDVGDQGWAIANMASLTLTPTWQRYELTSALQNGLSQLCLQIGNTLTSGQGFEIWGAQFSVGTDPGAYTPTPSTTTVIATNATGTLVQTGLNQTYSYDSFGNILQNGSFNSIYTANNQMFGYAYDASGNLLFDGLFNNMTWDAESRLTSVGGATYLYDADGNRVEKQGSEVTDTIYFGGQPIARYAAGQSTDLIYGPTGLLAEVPGTQTGVPVYRLTDNLGTNVGSLSASGTLVDAIDHNPFGQVITGGTNDPYFYTGKERDTESGLDYFGARYYGSSMGRWMSPDWADKPEAVPYSSLDNPQSLNLYGYVLNNPLSKSDPNGHEDCCDFAKGVVQGLVSSITGGALGSAPSSSDSASSLNGQMLGSAMVTAAGIVGDADAATKIGGGMMLAPETGGASLAVGAVGVGEATISTAAIQAGSNNAAAVGTAMQRRAGDFSNSTREGAIKDNADKNGGANKCEKCGGDVQRVGNQKGQSPPGDQLQVHHDPAIKDGGGKNSKAVVVCRDCHFEIHNP